MKNETPTLYLHMSKESKCIPLIHCWNLNPEFNIENCEILELPQKQTQKYFVDSHRINTFIENELIIKISKAYKGIIHHNK